MSIIAPTPGVISDLQCDDTASCISGFRLDGRIFQVLCYPIRADAVADQELGSGVLFGDHVTLAAITGVGPSTLAALSPSPASPSCTSPI